MADTTALKNRIRAAIKANDNQEITGPVLQQTLLDIVDELSNRIIDEYAFIGIAVPTTVPPSDLTEYSRIFYLTAQNGVYTNLGGIEISNEIAVIKYNGLSWSKESCIGIDTMPTANSENLVKSGGVQNELALGAVYDVSAHNNNATFADLQALLIDPNLNTLIPTNIRRSGMSIKFVSDNKYVQFRYMGIATTGNPNPFLNTDNWAFCSDDVLTENPEYIRVETDAEGKIMHSVSAEDGAYWFHKLKSPTLDSIMKEVQDFKEEIDDEVEQTIKDSQTELAQHYDYYNVSKHHSVRDVFNIYTANNGWKQIEYNSSLAQYDELDVYQIGEQCNYGGDTEHSYETTTSHRGVAPATITQEYVTRSKFILEEAIAVLPEEVLTSFAAGQKICFVDLNNFIEEWQITEIGTWERISPYDIKDPEDRIEIKLDAENKIVAYRKADGVWVECVGVETDSASINHLILTDTGITELQQALKNSGFRPGIINDFSDAGKDYPLRLPFPKVAAKVNFIVNRPITEECLNPFTGDDEQSGLMEYYDYYGNYFKKACIINTQGQTSQRNRKKNIGLDIDDGSEIIFGDWVAQDSFHIKSHPNDITGTRLIGAYRFVEKVYKAIGGRPFDSVNDNSDITTTNSTGNLQADFNSNVLCHPDGFAVEIYFNGEYWGEAMLQLKKHRKNYGMDKKDYESVLLDMNETLLYFWGGSNTIGWTVQGMMDIKNPKTLIAMDGTKWEEGKELIDSSSPAYDATNKDHKNTAKSKKIIEDMADAYNEVLSLESELDDNAAAKAKFEELFDKDACEAVYIINCFLKNGDSIKKNTLWMKYKGGKIAPAPYDLDGTFGGGVTGLSVGQPSATLWDGAYATSAWPLSFVWKYYKDELVAKYGILRDNKVISVDTFEEIFNTLFEQQGISGIEKEIEKWNPASYRSGGELNSQYWRKGSYGNEDTWTQWNKDTEYQVNACVFVVGDKNVNTEAIKGEKLYGIKYTAIAPNQNQCPVDTIYDNFPYTGGMYDSIKRELKWIEEQIALCDLKLEYNN